MRMWEFSAEDRQKPFHRPQVYADKFEQAFTNKANATLLDPAQYMCFPGDGTTFKKNKIHRKNIPVNHVLRNSPVV